MRDQINSRKQVILPVLFGIEAATNREIQSLNLPEGEIKVTDGQVSFCPVDEQEIPRLVARFNYNLRTAERVLIGLSSFVATSFDELYDKVRKLPWEDWLDRDYALAVTGYSLKSKLYGVPSMQSVIKKAIIDRLIKARNLLPHSHIVEDKNKGKLLIRFSAVRDIVTVMLDTTGAGLHKRGYRPLTHSAPLRETLAAAILDFLFYLRNQKQGEILFDPVCGSGTFLIEAAMLATGKAPGLMRGFAGQQLGLVGASIFQEEAEYARAKEKQSPCETICFGSDISQQSIKDARINADRAGVAKLVKFQTMDLKQLKSQEITRLSANGRALVIANPPYGERMSTIEESSQINRELGRLVLEQNTGMNKKGMRLGVITADNNFEYQVGFRADKRRKLYNGMISCQLYQYFKTDRRDKLKE